MTISNIGWVGKEQFVNEWLEKWVNHKNFRRQPKCLPIKLHTRCRNNKEDMRKKMCMMNVPTLHYYLPAGETIHKKHYCIITQHFRFCCGVEIANKYFNNIHLHMHFYFEKKSFSHILQTRCETPQKNELTFLSSVVYS